MAFSAGNLGGFDPKGVKKNFKHVNLQGNQARNNGGEALPAEPTESFEAGFTPLNDAKVDSASVNEGKAEVAAADVQSNAGVSMSGVPSLLTNADLNVGFNEIKPGLTAVNGLGSTTLTDLSGNIIASANALVPTTPVKTPTTSISSFGLGDTQFVTSSGRVIDGNPSVKMPTTSMGLVNGLESTEFTTTSGRVITV